MGDGEDWLVERQTRHTSPELTSQGGALLVVVEADVGQGPEEEGHDGEGDGLGDGGVHHREVVVDDEDSEELEEKEDVSEEVDVRIMLLSLWDLRTEIVVPESGQSWEPAGAFNTNKKKIVLHEIVSFEPNSNPVPPVLTAGHFLEEEREVEKLVADDIKKLWLVYQPVHNFLVRPQVLLNISHKEPRKVVFSSHLESSEDSVPD